jgi:hypothetical protein
MPTVTSPALTLAEHAKLTGNVAQKFAMSVYAGESILKYLKLQTNPALTMNGIQVTNAGLPGVNWGRINKAADETRATMQETAGSLFLITNQIAVDRRLLRAFKAGKAPRDPIQMQFDAYNAALRIEVMDKFLNGTGLAVDSQADALPGLRTMLSNPVDYYLANTAGVATTRLNANGLNMTPSGGSAATASNLSAIVEQLIFLMRGSYDTKNLLMIADSELLRQWQAKGRVGGFFDTTQDAFDRRITTYRDMPLIPTATAANGTTPLITTYETTAGVVGTPGTDKRTSFFIVDLDQVDCWQPQALSPEKLPVDGIWQPFLIDWGIGMMPSSNRWVGQVFNVLVTD